MTHTLEADWDAFCEIETRVEGAESTGLRARWECGLLLSKYESKKGHTNELTRAVQSLSSELGVLPKELYYRRQFATLYPTEEEFTLAGVSHKSWTAVIASFPKRESDPSPAMTANWKEAAKYARKLQEAIDRLGRNPWPHLTEEQATGYIQTLRSAQSQIDDLLSRKEVQDVS